MTLDEFKTIVKVMVPSADLNRVSDPAQTIFFNRAVEDINYFEEVLSGEKYFNATPEAVYPMSEIDTGIIKLGEGGVWYNYGTEDSPHYQQLRSVGRSFLDEKYPNWINDTEGYPLYVFEENHEIHVYPSPPAELTNGFYIPNCLYKPVKMTNGSHYPFTGSETERPDLVIFDDTILDYVRFILKHGVGSDQKGIITRQEYEATRKRAGKIFRSRLDYRTSIEWGKNG